MLYKGVKKQQSLLSSFSSKPHKSGSKATPDGDLCYSIHSFCSALRQRSRQQHSAHNRRCALLCGPVRCCAVGCCAAAPSRPVMPSADLPFLLSLPEVCDRCHRSVTIPENPKIPIPEYPVLDATFFLGFGTICEKCLRESQHIMELVLPDSHMDQKIHDGELKWKLK